MNGWTTLLLAAEERFEGGHVVGGWSYIWAAFALTWVALPLYGASLWLRQRKGK